MTECNYCRGPFSRIITVDLFDLITDRWKRRCYCDVCFERVRAFYDDDEIRRIETINELLDWRRFGF
jgi:hypothetical protein